MATGHGGKRPGAGRKPGKVGEAKRELQDMAKDRAMEALDTLCQIMADVDQPASARVSAANAVLDRGYGKAPQAITGPDGGPIQTEATLDVSSLSDAALAELYAAMNRDGSDPA